MEDVLPNIYQTILTNFGDTKYTGPSKEEAMDCAVWCGFEAIVLLDGAFVASYSPIGGWRK